jgi:hypothetical protein
MIAMPLPINKARLATATLWQKPTGTWLGRQGLLICDKSHGSSLTVFPAELAFNYNRIYEGDPITA